MKHGYIDASTTYQPRKIIHFSTYFYQKYILSKKGGGYCGYDFEMNEDESNGIREIFIGNKKIHYKIKHTSNMSKKKIA